MKKPPAEIVASLLAITTILLSLPPYNLPPWAIFISWAGTFAMGGPSRENLGRIWRVMPIGSFFAMIITLSFFKASHYFSGTSFIISQMVILFVFNTALLLIARIKTFAFPPGMFFGFASYFATMFGGFGPIPKNPYAAFVAVVIMNAIGPAYAWINYNFASHREHHA
ncbi:MAG TPA: DUF1097 domain-containing protein [Burkholderiales bacterium]|nr:DUF1097 domain-containing protein [Burkholderiales bacterium]